MQSDFAVPRRLLVRPAEHFAADAAEWIAARIRSSVASRGTCGLALSGGSTPGPVYRLLARAAVPWADVEVFFVDDRCVPPEHVDSNQRMVRETLLAGLPEQPAAVWTIDGTAEPGEAAAAYERVLPVHLDVVVLGMGRDAHTASLFPGSAAIAEEARRVLNVAGPAGGHARITLTPPALLAARDRIVLVAGEDKAATAAAVFDSPIDVNLRPAQIVLDGTWILDENAARDLVDPV